MEAKKYKLVPIWRQLEKVTHSYDFTPLWQNLINDNFEFKTDLESLLYKKITYFLLYGSAGFLFLINQAIGEENLVIFIEFVKDYITNDSTPGHYYPSAEVSKNIEAIRGIADTFDFEETLNEISKILESSHGVDDPKGWNYREK